MTRKAPNLINAKLVKPWSFHRINQELLNRSVELNKGFIDFTEQNFKNRKLN